MMRSIRFLLPAVAFSLAACDTDSAMSPPVDVASLVPSGVAQVVLQRDAGPEAGLATYTVRVIAHDMPLAAYQGAVTFPKGALEIVSVVTGESAEGEQRMANAQAAEGRIRFAAFATESFESDVAFRFVVREASGAVALQAGLDVAGLVNGQAMEAAQLRAAAGVHDARTGQLIDGR
ncbi:MAG TPA: hypothetical protein VFM71_05010 [Gemmatimonadaceae bacterium]|nr:hypothetical protein [Gemmatimonadaceae bacterium]